jgi:hypothetical protein
MAHRRKKKRDAEFVAPHVRRLVRRLAHPHRIDRGIEAVECGTVAVELIAENEDEIS